jgi:hypothetical protein
VTRVTLLREGPLRLQSRSSASGAGSVLKATACRHDGMRVDGMPIAGISGLRWSSLPPSMDMNVIRVQPAARRAK